MRRAITAKQIIKQLKKAGFVEIGQTGSHLKLFDKESRTPIVPIDSSKVIFIETLKVIEKQADIKFL